MAESQAIRASVACPLAIADAEIILTGEMEEI